MRRGLAAAREWCWAARSTSRCSRGERCRQLRGTSSRTRSSTWRSSATGNVEMLVVTGAVPAARFMVVADLVTEMREVKHHYEGVIARRGIEF